MTQVIALKILDIEFDFDGDDISLNEQRKLTERVKYSEITVVKDDPDQTLEELACNVISDQEGYCINDIRVEGLRANPLLSRDIINETDVRALMTPDPEVLKKCNCYDPANRSVGFVIARPDRPAFIRYAFVHIGYNQERARPWFVSCGLNRGKSYKSFTPVRKRLLKNLEVLGS